MNAGGCAALTGACYIRELDPRVDREAHGLERDRILDAVDSGICEPPNAIDARVSLLEK
jgi:hypothetical protein